MNPTNKGIYRLLASPYTLPLSLQDVEKSVRFETAIKALAISSGTTISLHDYAEHKKSTSLDIVLECSEAFLEKVKTLADFHALAPLTEETRRIEAFPPLQARPPLTSKRPGL